MNFSVSPNNQFAAHKILAEPIKKNKNIGFRVTQSEFADLYEFCVDKNLTISKLIRKAVNEFIAKETLCSVDS